MQRLQPIQDEERALLLDQLGQALALVPGRTGGRVGVAKPGQRGGDERVGRDLSPFRRALAVERPAYTRSRYSYPLSVTLTCSYPMT